MFKVLCKIWRFVLKIFKMVIDGILEALGVVIKALMNLASDIWKGLFGSGGIGLGGMLTLAALGFGAWMLWGVYSDKKEKEQEREHALRIARLQHGGYQYEQGTV